MNWITRGICLCACLLSIAFAQTKKSPEYLKQATVSETEKTVRITANNPRPLAQVLDALRLKYDWAVSYEDPQYLASADVVDLADGTEHTKVPAGSSFNVEFPAPASDQEKILRLVVDAYNQSKNPGQFEVRRDAQGGFSVVGTAAHDDKGAVTQQQAPLDLLVTVPAEDRTISATMDLIWQAIAQQSHVTIQTGVHPRSLMDHIPAKIGGTKIPARDLLLQCASATHRTMYWRLLFDPQSKTYYFDMHAIPPATRH